MDKDYIKEHLKTKEIGQTIVVLEETDSTNNQAKNMAIQNGSHGTVVIAETQHAGKGRQEKKWVSKAGAAITMSIILKLNIEAKEITKIPLLVGVAVREELEKLCSQKVFIKWPNDIIIDYKKICGILVESTIKGEYADWIVVGIGININQTEEDLKDISHATSLLIQEGKSFYREDIICKILFRLEKRLNAFLNSKKLDICELEETSALVGKKINVNNITGIVIGFKDDGTMLVKDDFGKVVEINENTTVRGITSYLN